MLSFRMYRPWAPLSHRARGCHAQRSHHDLSEKRSGPPWYPTRVPELLQILPRVSKGVKECSQRTWQALRTPAQAASEVVLPQVAKPLRAQQAKRAKHDQQHACRCLATSLLGATPCQALCPECPAVTLNRAQEPAMVFGSPGQHKGRAVARAHQVQRQRAQRGRQRLAQLHHRHLRDMGKAK